MESTKIKHKAFLGLLQLMATLCAIIFLSAGTLNFWQGWLYLFIFGMSCLWVTLYLMNQDMALLERRLKAGPGGEKEITQKMIQIFASLSFVCIMLVPGLDQRFSWSHVPVSLTVFSDLMATSGFYIVFLVFRENTYTSAVIETAEGQSVISTGPYAKVRHPMYSGALLMLLFTPMALDSFWGLIFFFPIFFVIVARLLDEEKFLSKNLSGYREYCEKVSYRLVPGLW
jgi:protein-S-isoprenylcysteine O-methyltransferase Ste14